MTRITANPELVTWAHERAGLDSLALAGRFPKLSEWETGELQPTLGQLEDRTRAVHVAVGLLFLPAPPDEPLPIPDFRTGGNRELKRPNPNLLDKNAEGRVFSIDKVADEVAAGGDELTDWMCDHGNGLFVKIGAAVAAQFGTVSNWVTQQQYKPPAPIHTFLQVADYYLIAHALADKHVVVTHEVPANSVKRIKIPNACIGLNLHIMTPYEMLRRERAQFVLGGVQK